MQMPPYPTGVSAATTVSKVSTLFTDFQIVLRLFLGNNIFPFHLQAGVLELRPAALHPPNSSVVWKKSVQIARIMENINSLPQKNQ